MVGHENRCRYGIRIFVDRRQRPTVGDPGFCNCACGANPSEISDDLVIEPGDKMSLTLELISERHRHLSELEAIERRKPRHKIADQAQRKRRVRKPRDQELSHRGSIRSSWAWRAVNTSPEPTKELRRYPLG